MKVLYVTSACLTKNTSANMSHNGYLKGLIDAGCDVDVIMAKDSWGKVDKALPKWKDVNYYEFETKSFGEKLRAKLRGASNHIISTPAQTSPTVEGTKSGNEKTLKFNFQSSLKNLARTIFLSIFKPDPLYPLESAIFKSVLSFNSKEKYDLIVSNSSPAASHKIVEILIKKNKVKFNRWVQIWEDPWYYDLYGGHSEQVLQEEHRLLQAASEIFYVSPLTMMYQKRYFPDCASKMGFVPLPFFEYENKSEKHQKDENLVFGYFGDYYSVTRNLKPFYDAIKQTSYQAYINGDTDLILQPTETIHIAGRVTLDVLASIQEKTTVLVHLCNLKGGQIPGKIYHYSATNKKILFILDGTEEEQKMLIDFFRPYNRYFFCKNTKEDILRSIEDMKNKNKNIINEKVKDFEPCNVVKNIIYNN